ncbi:MAG: DNA repair protein RecO [Cyanobacteria bacterium P01_A01_bin.45]
MSKTYKATGINLKAIAFGESDRLLTVLTREFGLIRAIAPGARKPKSSLGARSGMFVVNDLLVAKGKNLDKITQAQTVKNYPGIAKDLGKLAASQYLAEIVLCQAISEQPQIELYELFTEHLHRLENVSNSQSSDVLSYLAHGVFQLLALGGLTPQVEVCCLTQQPLELDFTNPKWRVGFSINAGGTVCLGAWKRRRQHTENLSFDINNNTRNYPAAVKENLPTYETIVHTQEEAKISYQLNVAQLQMMRNLLKPLMIPSNESKDAWLLIERVLRHYTQYHLGCSIRSATLIDSYFATNHDAII